MRWLIVFFSLLLILLQYPIWFSDSSLPSAWRLQSQIDAQKIENQKLEERNRLLKAEVEDLKKGLEVVEEKARTELGLIKDGETYYQVIDNQAVKRAEVETTVNKIELIEERFSLSPREIHND